MYIAVLGRFEEPTKIKCGGKTPVTLWLASTLRKYVYQATKWEFDDVAKYGTKEELKEIETKLEKIEQVDLTVESNCLEFIEEHTDGFNYSTTLTEIVDGLEIY